MSATCAYNSIAGEADSPKNVLNEILEYVDTLKKKGLSYEDFLRSKRVMYAEFVKSFDSTDNIANDLMSFYFDGADYPMQAEYYFVKNIGLIAFNTEVGNFTLVPGK